MSDLTPGDIEAIVWNEPKGKKLELRLWLRLLSCANLISSEIRSNLRVGFDVTLPRFDLMAQLYREPDGLRLGALSRRMMVTNGNITGLVDRLVEEGLISRESVLKDRRAMIVRLTDSGRAKFALMAAEHESWLRRLFADVSRRDLARLTDALEELKTSVQANSSADSE